MPAVVVHDHDAARDAGERAVAAVRHGPGGAAHGRRAVAPAGAVAPARPAPHSPDHAAGARPGSAAPRLAAAEARAAQVDVGQPPVAPGLAHLEDAAVEV